MVLWHGSPKSNTNERTCEDKREHHGTYRQGVHKLSISPLA
jgi:hypothetical protein